MFLFTPENDLSQLSPIIGWSKVASSYLYSILFLYAEGV